MAAGTAVYLLIVNAELDGLNPNYYLSRVDEI
jgi:hypothetical protein